MFISRVCFLLGCITLIIATSVFADDCSDEPCGTNGNCVEYKVRVDSSYSSSDYAPYSSSSNYDPDVLSSSSSKVVDYEYDEKRSSSSSSSSKMSDLVSSTSDKSDINDSSNDSFSSSSSVKDDTVKDDNVNDDAIVEDSYVRDDDYSSSDEKDDSVKDDFYSEDSEDSDRSDSDRSSEEGYDRYTSESEEGSDRYSSEEGSDKEGSDKSEPIGSGDQRKLLNSDSSREGDNDAEYSIDDDKYSTSSRYVDNPDEVDNDKSSSSEPRIVEDKSSSSSPRVISDPDFVETSSKVDDDKDRSSSSKYSDPDFVETSSKVDDDKDKSSSSKYSQYETSSKYINDKSSSSVDSFEDSSYDGKMSSSSKYEDSSSDEVEYIYYYECQCDTGFTGVICDIAEISDEEIKETITDDEGVVTNYIEGLAEPYYLLKAKLESVFQGSVDKWSDEEETKFRWAVVNAMFENLDKKEISWCTVTSVSDYVESRRRLLEDSKSTLVEYQIKVESTSESDIKSAYDIVESLVVETFVESLKMNLEAETFVFDSSSVSAVVSQEAQKEVYTATIDSSGSSSIINNNSSSSSSSSSPNLDEDWFMSSSSSFYSAAPALSINGIYLASISLIALALF